MAEIAADTISKAVGMRRRISQHEGIGRVQCLSDPLLPISYSLGEYEDSIPVDTLDAPHPATIPGLRDIRGQLRWESGVSPALPPLEPFTLHLQDGRKLRLFVETWGHRSVTVRATGGFF
jgi:hypothetical protein